MPLCTGILREGKSSFIFFLYLPNFCSPKFGGGGGKPFEDFPSLQVSQRDTDEEEDACESPVK